MQLIAYNRPPADINSLPLPQRVLDSYQSKAKTVHTLNMNTAIKYTDFCKLSTVKVYLHLFLYKTLNAFLFELFC